MTTEAQAPKPHGALDEVGIAEWLEQSGGGGEEEDVVDVLKRRSGATYPEITLGRPRTCSQGPEPHSGLVATVCHYTTASCRKTHSQCLLCRGMLATFVLGIRLATTCLGSCS